MSDLKPQKNKLVQIRLALLASSKYLKRYCRISFGRSDRLPLVEEGHLILLSEVEPEIFVLAIGKLDELAIGVLDQVFNVHNQKFWVPLQMDSQLGLFVVKHRVGEESRRSHMSVKIVWETLSDSDSPAQVCVLLRGENKVVVSVNAGQCDGFGLPMESNICML